MFVNKVSQTPPRGVNEQTAMARHRETPSAPRRRNSHLAPHITTPKIGARAKKAGELKHFRCNSVKIPQPFQ